MFNTRVLAPAAALIALHLIASPLAAQAPCTFVGGTTCSLAPHNLDATVVALGKLSITGTGTTAIPSGIADFEASETTLGTAVTGPTISSKSNKTFSVTMEYPANFTDFAATPIAKPQNQAAFRFIAPGACNADDTGYAPLAGTSVTIHSSIAPTTIDRQVCLKVKWLWASDGPGNYRLPVTFKITAP